MKRIYVGPFHRFAYERQGSGVLIFDAESGAPGDTLIKIVLSEDEACTYIEQLIAADPSMREDFNDAT